MYGVSALQCFLTGPCAATVFYMRQMVDEEVARKKPLCVCVCVQCVLSSPCSIIDALWRVSAPQVCFVLNSSQLAGWNITFSLSVLHSAVSWWVCCFYLSLHCMSSFWSRRLHNILLLGEGALDERIHSLSKKRKILFLHLNLTPFISFIFLNHRNHRRRSPVPPQKPFNQFGQFKAPLLTSSECADVVGVTPCFVPQG